MLFSIDELLSYVDYSTFYEPRLSSRPGEFSIGISHTVGCMHLAWSETQVDQWHTFVVMSDGELQEGSNWEA